MGQQWLAEALMKGDQNKKKAVFVVGENYLFLRILKLIETHNSHGWLFTTATKKFRLPINNFFYNSFLSISNWSSRSEMFGRNSSTLLISRGFLILWRIQDRRLRIRIHILNRRSRRLGVNHHISFVMMTMMMSVLSQPARASYAKTHQNNEENDKETAGTRSGNVHRAH